jgi:hypothetical protein
MRRNNGIQIIPPVDMLARPVRYAWKARGSSFYWTANSLDRLKSEVWRPAQATEMVAKKQGTQLKGGFDLRNHEAIVMIKTNFLHRLSPSILPFDQDQETEIFRHHVVDKEEVDPLSAAPFPQLQNPQYGVQPHAHSVFCHWYPPRREK